MNLIGRKEEFLEGRRIDKQQFGRRLVDRMVMAVMANNVSGRLDRKRLKHFKEENEDEQEIFAKKLKHLHGASAADSDQTVEKQHEGFFANNEPIIPTAKRRPPVESVPLDSPKRTKHQDTLEYSDGLASDLAASPPTPPSHLLRLLMGEDRLARQYCHQQHAFVQFNNKNNNRS